MSQNKTGGLEEAKTYMRDKEIPQLFESMMTALMFKKPENHLDFLEECLLKAKDQPKVKWHTFIEPLPPIPRKEKELKLESQVDDAPKVTVKTYSPLPAIGSQEPVKSTTEETDDTATEAIVVKSEVEISVTVEGDSVENGSSEIVVEVETEEVADVSVDVNSADNTEAESEVVAADAEAETGVVAADVKAETEVIAADVEAETGVVDADAEAETEVIAGDAEIDTEVIADANVEVGEDGVDAGVAVGDGAESAVTADEGNGEVVTVDAEVETETDKNISSEEVATDVDKTVTIEVTGAEETPLEETDVPDDDATIDVPQWDGDSSRLSEKPVMFVLGGPGSGKGTQCAKIVDKFNFLHLSAGDLLRKEAAEKGGELAEIMKQGQLVPQGVTIGLLKQAMLDNADSKGFLIDGFPREIQQGLTFEKEVTSPKLVFAYTCPDDILMERLLARGKHSGRVDDNEESIKKRLELFHGVSEPVIAHYGDIVRTIDSSVPVDDVFAATCKVLEQIDCVSEDVVKEENIVPVEETITGGKGKIRHLFDDNIKFVFSVGFEGCGKTEQCEKIVEKFGFTLLSRDAIVKKEIESGSERAQRITEAGVPPELAVELLGEAILNLENVDKILIDGFPSSVKEAEEFEEEIAPAKLFIYFSCTHEDLKSDIDVETVQKELASFETGITPILEKYKERDGGIQIPLGGSEEEISGNIEKVFSGLTNDNSAGETQEESSVPNIVLVLGGPGCGKGTQCERIVEKYGYCHLSTGDLLRDEVKQDTERANTLNDIMKKGELVPTDVILQLLSQAIEEKKDSKGFLIDGFPRDVEQGVKFEETVGKSKSILYFKCSEECMTERLLERAKTSGRADDNIDTIKLRLKTFAEQTIPVVEKFKDLVKEVDAERSVDDIFTDVCEHLDSI